MTLLVSVPQNTYSPLSRTLDFNVGADDTRMEVTLTHPNTLAAWPDGPLLTFEVLWNGVPQGLATIGGGVRNDKTGSPIVGNVATAFGINKPAGLTSGQVRLVALQTLTTAILAEAF